METLFKRHGIPFLSAMAAGLSAHAAACFGFLSYHDDVYNLFDVGNSWYVGRFMLGILGKALRVLTGGSHFSLPWFHGLITLLLLSLTACVLADVLDMSSVLSRALAGVLMTTMPYTAAFFGFMFTAPYYALAMLMCVCGCAFVVRAAQGETARVKPGTGYAAGVLLLALSPGIYQAVLPFAASVFLARLLLRALQTKRERRAFYREGALYAGVLAASLALYFMLVRAFLHVLHLELSDYGGMNEMGTVGASVYAARIARAYRTFFMPEKTASWNMYPATGLFLYMAALCGILVCAVILLAGKNGEKRTDPVQLLLPLFLMPLAVNGVFVMNDAPFIHSLVMFPQTVVFFLLTALAERVTRFRGKVLHAALILCALLSVFYIRYDNICYLSARVLQENTKAYFETMITRIKSVSGYDDALPLVFIGEREITDESLTRYPAFEAVITTPYANSLAVYVNDYAWKEFMAYRCGFSPVWGDAAPFEGDPAVSAMPVWPDDGSIQVIDDTVIVKLK